MKKLGYGLALGITTALVSLPVQAAPLSEILPGLVESHPQIKAATKSVDASKATKEEAFSGFLPLATLSGSTGWEQTDRTNTDPPGEKRNLPTDSWSMSVTQNVFQGFRTQADTQSADVGIDIAKSTLELTRQQIIFEGVTAYLEVLRQIQLTELAQENMGTLKKQLNLEDERVKRGSGIAVDVLQSKSRLQISKERHTAFMGALKDAISRFTQVYGRPPEIENMAIPDIPLGQLPPTLDEAISVAVAENPGLASSNYNVEVASLAQTSAKSGFYPSVNLVAQSTYDNNLSGTSGEETNHSFVVEANWDIFSGFADKARTERAASEYQAAMNNHHHTHRKTIEEVKLAWSSLTTSKARLDLLNNAVNIAGEVYDARKRLRDAGKETALNVLDAENELFRAKIDAASARFDYYTAVYRLLLSMGRLNLNTAI